METVTTVDVQDGSPIDLATVGVRKPRSGSIRKPRAGSHTIVAFDQEVLSPFSGSPSGPNLSNEGDDYPSRYLAQDADLARMPGRDTAGDRDRAHSLSREKFRESLKESGGLTGHSHARRLEDGEDRNELKMFQRRERKRDDDRPYVRDSSRPSLKSWKDSDMSDRSTGKDENRRACSPEYERAKKQKDSAEKPERSWKEKESSERRHKDLGYREKDDSHSKSSWHRNRGSQTSRDSAYSDRGDFSWTDRGYKEKHDYTSKDRSHRDREEQSHGGHKDWNCRDYLRDRDYDKLERPPESKDSLSKSRNGNASGEAAERHSSQQSHSINSGSEHRHGSFPQRSSATSTGGGQSSHAYDRESHSLIENLSLGRSSQKDQPQSENISLGFCQGSNPQNRNAVGSSSSLHGTIGYEKGGELSIVMTEGGSRSLPKLKLKVGGISQTLHSDGRRQPEGGDSVDGGINRTAYQTRPLKKMSTSTPELYRRRQRLILQEDSDEEDDAPPSAKEHVQASEDDGFLAYLADEPNYRRVQGGSSLGNNWNLPGVRKSSRVPKKRVFDGDDDAEPEPKRRRRKKVEVDSDEDLYRIEEDEVEHDLVEDDDVEAASEVKVKINRRRRKSLEADLPGGDGRRVAAGAGKTGVSSDTRMGVPLTARQRALQSSKEGLVEVGPSLVEFPEGLIHSAAKKQKELLTAAERQLKKEEAAQKRRQQVEKTEKEIQAVAIQKILCQDSQRKKREGKLQKQREEMEQEKKAAAMAPASNSIRWVLGPNGTVVSFSQDLELPKNFSGPLSYPQERERCAGPSCNNAYKYRDSKTLLPLCSLQCYRAVQKPSEAALAH